MEQLGGDQEMFEMKMEGTYIVAAATISRWFKIVLIILSRLAGVQGEKQPGDTGQVPGGWHGRNVEPYSYDPGEECLLAAGKILYCPNIATSEKTFCCGKDVKECCTSEEWVMEQL